MTPTLIVGFRKAAAKNTFQSKVMSYGLGHDIVHCELIFPNQPKIRLVADIKYKGVTMLPLMEEMGDLTEWIFYDLGVENYEKALELAKKLVGKPYDLRSVIASLFGLQKNNQEAWYCSELCYYILLNTGFPLPVFPPDTVLPHELELMLRDSYPTINLVDVIV
jgi:hypothetical protein